MFPIQDINKTWTLFLDRDGVINHEKALDYIYHWEEFVFYDGVLEALKIFAETFETIVITTNQRGIGKGLMTEADLEDIHTKMTAAIEKAGGRIDSIYYCSSLDNHHPSRKPNPGMAWQAKKDFPAIDFNKSIMIGNNISDMDFGKNAGMHTVFVKTTHPQQTYPHPSIDLICNNLLNFAEMLKPA